MGGCEIMEDKIYYLIKNIGYWEDATDVDCGVCFQASNIKELRKLVRDWIINVYLQRGSDGIKVEFKYIKCLDYVTVYVGDESFELKEMLLYGSLNKKQTLSQDFGKLYEQAKKGNEFIAYYDYFHSRYTVLIRYIAMWDKVIAIHNADVINEGNKDDFIKRCKEVNLYYCTEAIRNIDDGK